MTTHTAITDYFAGATLDAGSLLCHRTTDATVETASATGEISAGSAVYSAVFSDVAAGRYRLKLLSGGDVVATRDVEFAGTDAEVVETGYAVLDAATQTQLDRIEANNGTGARTVTITVNDGATVLQNATVRMTEGANAFTALTNASGVAVFNLDDATYTVSITKSGYSYAGTTLVVNGTETVTYSMTAMSVTPPADPALCAVTIHVRDQYGIDAADVPVEITFVQWDDTATETPPVLSIPPVQTTDSGGLVQVNLYRLAVYKIIYGEARNARRWDGTIPDAGSYEVEL